MYEIEPLISNIHKKNKESWEQARLISYVMVQCNSSKKLKPTDIIKFCWDEEDSTSTSISNDDIRRLKEKAKQYITEK